MNDKCDKMKDQITDLVTGILPETEMRTLEQHLSECPACRDYARALQKEDRLLTGLFAEFNANMAGQENEVINAINLLGASSRVNIISVGRMIMKSSITRLATTAAVIVFVVLYFTITLIWISQIRECIQGCIL